MNLPPDVCYAGFWRRLAAFLIDMVILMPMLVLLLYLVYGSAYFSGMLEATARITRGDAGDSLALHGTGDALITVLLPVVLVVYFWMIHLGTPGKLWLGCHLVDATTGAPLRLRQAILRNLGYLFSSVFGLGFLWIVWDPRKQGLHDKIAGSVVIHAVRRKSVSSEGTP